MAQPLTVLIVDDEPSILRTLSLCLRRAGFACETFSDSRAALERLRKDPPVHILLTDVVMPGMDGLEMIRILREEGAFTQVVVMTAYSSVDRILEAYRLGASDFLPKPFENLEQVVSVVRAAEARYQRWRAALTRTLKREAP